MENKPNQPASGTTPSSATTPTDSAAGVDNGSFDTVNSTSQPATATPKATRKAAPTTTDAAASTAESSQPQDQGQTAPRKSWLNQEELLKGVNQLPQSLKDLGTKAIEQVNGLTPTQRIVGGALLVSGLSWLALRSKKAKSTSDIYEPKNSKWKASTDSVYRGASAGLHDSDTSYSYNTENGF